MTTATDTIWENWVGEQSIEEFLSYCEPDLTVEGNVEEYVEEVLAGRVFGPVEYDGNRWDITNGILRYMEQHRFAVGADVTIHGHRGTFLSVDRQGTARVREDDTQAERAIAALSPQLQPHTGH